MFNTIFKTIIIYFTIVVAMRIMGKRQIAQLQPYELVLALLIAEVTAKPMDTPGTPLSYGLVSAVTLMLLYFLITRLSLKSDGFKKLLSSKPSIVISKGVISRKELTKLDYSLSDLVEQIRSKGFLDICEVEYAILETNGQLSVFPVAKKTPPTVSDLNLQIKPVNLAYAIIMDGKFQKDNLKKSGVDPQTVLKALSRVGITDIKNVFYASLHDSNQLFIQQKNGGIKNASMPKSEVRNG
jgi:Predicted membrane protein